MGDVVDRMRIAEPAEWFIVFHRTSVNPVLSFLAFGELKHVSAFGYCAGFKAWVMYDVRWSGTVLRVVDQAALIEITRGCDIVKAARSPERMGLSNRLGFTCVSAIKHLLGLRCVAVTPGGLYRHILRNGGILIHGERRPPAGCPAAT